MADFQRLARAVIGLVVGLLLGGVTSYAFAAAYEITSAEGANSHLVGLRYEGDLNGFALWVKPRVVFPETVDYSPQFMGATSCGAAIYESNQNPYMGFSFYQQYCHPAYVGGTSALTGVRYRVYYTSIPGITCPDGMPCDPNTGQCFTCPDGRIWNGTTCESPCEAKAGNSYGTANSWAVLDADRVPSGAPTFCADQCQVTGGKVECESVSAGGTTGDYVSLGVSCAVQGPFTYTGQGCGPVGSMPQLVGVDDAQKPWWSLGDDMKDCSAQGGYWGNVNGIDVCVRPQSGETFDKETSTGNETTGTSETAADGTTTEKTTSTTTECKDGKCTTTTTTTTTTKGGDGQQIGDPTTESRTETKPEADFCKANPQHAQCAGTKTGGSFSGGCTTGFACTGDAVQCAIAQAAHNQACAMAVGDGVLGQFEQITGFDGTAPGEGLDRKQIDVPESLQVAEIGGGTGLQDQTFVIMGRSIDIPFSVLNQYIEMLGYAIMLIAWIGAWRIIAGAF